jgi:hypothetical protein
MAIDYTTILLKKIRDQNKAILEGQKDQATHADIYRLEQRLGKVEGDIQTIKAAVIDTSRDLNEHKDMPADKAHGVGRSRWAAA